MATGNQTNITPPRVSLIDERTGAVSREWYRWFYSLFTTLGSGTGIIPVDAGGTGLGTIPTNGQLLIGNGTGYALNTLGYGAGISVVNGTGTITVANTGVLSNIAGTGISVSSATGNVTIANTGVLSFSAGTTGLTPATATTGAVTLAGTLAIASGGTNGTATPTAYGVAYGTGTAYAFTAAGTAKQVLIANTSAAPTWSTLTSGTSILYGDGSGGFSNVTIGSGVSFVGGTLSATGSGGTVTSVTGTSPVVSSGGNTPAISLAAAYGDTLNPYASKTANTILAAPSGSVGVPTFRALTTTDIPALSYVSSVGATAPITSTGGLTPTIGVTSAALSKTDDTNVTMTLSGAPTTALLAATTMSLGWTGQLAVSRGGTGAALTTANFVFAGPTSGAPAAPTFRALTTADVSSLGYVTSVSGTTGRITSTSGTTPIIDLASGVITAGTTGSITAIPVITVDTYGRVTSITTAANPQGTVTSVAALTLGTTGTDLSSTVANGTTTPVITLNVPTASASNRGALSSTDWTTFNNKGSVTSVSFTGGLITVSTATTTPALTVAGTSGGIVYFSSASTWASSAALAANALVIGGGAGVAPRTTTTGTGVITALGTNVGTAGAFVVNGGALGTPSSGTVTNLTGTASININGTVGATTPAAGSFSSLTTSGNVLVTSPAGLGYGTGSGGTVTQATDKSTGVTINKPTGQITMNNALLLPATSVSFVVNNSFCSGTDVPIVSVGGNANSNLSYQCTVSFTTAGRFDIMLRNVSAGSLSEALVINFAIIKGVAS